jgi:hypothetical protein
MISSALEDLAQAMLKQGKLLPVPSHDAHSQDADLIKIHPLSVYQEAIRGEAALSSWTPGP